jgi:predicted DNA-binding transcriptional regulator YafY
MSRPDRLFRLLDALRRLPAPVTAARLAQETEVSERTLYRDIDTLRSGGALIDGAAGVGYTLTEDPALPPQMFTRLEVEALMLGLAEVRLLGDAALARASDMAGAKIVASLPERVQRQALHAVQGVYRYERPPTAPPHITILREASWDEAVVHITYTDNDGSQTARDIWPLSIVYLDRTLMLLAWCCLRQGFRRFKLPQIGTVAPTGAHFRPRRVPLLREFHAQMRARTE